MSLSYIVLLYTTIWIRCHLFTGELHVEPKPTGFFTPAPHDLIFQSVWIDTPLGSHLPP
jgi:hypothetical protein